MGTKRDHDDDDANGCLIALLGVVIGVPLGGFLNTEAAMLNWNWFAAPLGAPHVRFWQMYGLFLVFACFTHYRAPDNSQYKGKSLGQIVAMMIVLILVRFAAAAGIGYLVHSWAFS